MESKPEFVDANIFLRYLTGDDPEQSREAEGLLDRAAEGPAQLVTTVMTIAEIVWVMESYYELAKAEIEQKVLAILSAPGIEVLEREHVLQAVVWYEEKNVDFIDAYHAAWMMGLGLETAHTFDKKHFSRFEHIDVRVPGEKRTS